MKELYRVILPRLNTKLGNAATTVPGKNGFEICRQIVQDEDPCLDNDSFAMGLEIQKMSHRRCKNLDETKQFMMRLEKKAVEYHKKIGQRPPNDLLVRVLFEVLDAKTADDAEQQGLDTLETTYKDLCKLITKKSQKTFGAKQPQEN